MNPTGTIYLQANLNYVWTENDVYEIAQTDEIEGASMGASFGGLGVDNQPHQALLNKVNLVHAKQIADEALIATLVNQQFIASLGPTGYLELPSVDEVLGDISIILQWGVFSLLPYAAQLNGPAPLPIPSSFPITFSIAFPNAIWQLIPYLETNDATTDIGVANAVASVFMPLTPLGLLNNSIVYTTQAGNQTGFDILISNRNGPGLTAFNWVALGY